jgi:hypothetical protein
MGVKGGVSRREGDETWVPNGSVGRDQIFLPSYMGFEITA